ncbi:MAG: twin-arginine translocation signal domain-containing protein [Rhizobiales bacterium]|jgi:hypothetical protein|nr:twin-arginine translocation signal domain-containing protein [Hyphomicrobiales bacterium]
MKQQDKKAVGRREFLRTLGAGAGVAAVAATPMAATKADAQTKDDPKTKARYQDSDHVKTFYRVNSY